jgi:hypothetical protein
MMPGVSVQLAFVEHLREPLELAGHPLTDRGSQVTARAEDLHVLGQLVVEGSGSEAFE